ncbi:MAG: hypothetical protein IPL78_09975 [Chloroflexi bacterium]|nr:hypothetical protein [Chloroflexota bacterium]
MYCLRSVSIRNPLLSLPHPYTLPTRHHLNPPPLQIIRHHPLKLRQHQHQQLGSISLPPTKTNPMHRDQAYLNIQVRSIILLNYYGDME